MVGFQRNLALTTVRGLSTTIDVHDVHVKIVFNLWNGSALTWFHHETFPMWWVHWKTFTFRIQAWNVPTIFISFKRSRPVTCIVPQGYSWKMHPRPKTPLLSRANLEYLYEYATFPIWNYNSLRCYLKKVNSLLSSGWETTRDPKLLRLDHDFKEANDNRQRFNSMKSSTQWKWNERRLKCLDMYVWRLSLQFLDVCDFLNERYCREFKR